MFSVSCAPLQRLDTCNIPGGVYEVRMHNLLRDLRYTLRQLRRSPGFASISILTLTMAIAANVIVFGVLNAIMFHPLPVPQDQQLVQIQGMSSNDVSMSYPNYR